MTKAIKQNDVQLAAIEKDKVETTQRNQKKEREKSGEIYKPKLFKPGPEDFWTFIGFEYVLLLFLFYELTYFISSDEWKELQQKNLEEELLKKYSVKPQQ